MKKVLLAGFFMFFACAKANASFVSVITADELDGVEVTVTFEDLTTAVATLTADGVESASVSSTDFALSIFGETFGEASAGIWSFANLSNLGVVSIFIDAITAGIVFDPVEGGVAGPGGAGRPFFADTAGVIGEFGAAVVAGELFGTLTISAGGALLPPELQFVIDTDAVAAVPAPAMVGLLIFVCGAFAARRKLA